MISFGPAGNSESFSKMGYKSSLDVPEYLEKMGLNAFEYQCGRGVRISEENARLLGTGLKEKGIAISLHAPYYISLSGTDEVKRLGSIDYIMQSARAVDWLGGTRIVVHSGSASKISREHAVELAKDTLFKAQQALDSEGLAHINICPETMGKVGQLGTLEEVIELCLIDERFIPCIDFGHLNARTFGGIKEKSDYKEILEKLANKLGSYRSKNFHVHFSKIEYTNPGGEKRHLTFEDTQYGPKYEPLGELCVELDLTPTFICESAGTQAEDAKYMKEYYYKLLKIGSRRIMKKLLRLMKKLPENLDAALITGDVNRRYYTEFSSSAGIIVITRDESYLIVDARYFEAASSQAVNCTVILQENLTDQISQLLKKHGAKKVGLENATLPVAKLEEFKAQFAEFELVYDSTLSDTINTQRAVKCPCEKALIQTSQEITDKTFEYALSIIKAGKTEQEIALEMEFFNRRNGSEGAAFSYIVASGPNTSRPHAVPTTREIKKGDFVLMDFGSTYKGYLSDMTRVVAVGEPSELQKEVYSIVLESQKRAMEIIKEGVVFKDVHMIASDYIDSTKFAGKFTHGLGHSLGLEIHEPPNFNSITVSKALAGNVLSVEPGIYLSGEFGVRIEDIVYITENSFDNFTSSTKELIVL